MIRMLKAWNGYPQQAIVSLSGSEETRLVGLGLASFDIDGEADAEFLVKAKTNPLTGGSMISHSGGIGLILRQAGSAADASYNTAILQSEVDKYPGARVSIAGGQGVVEINGTIYHDNIISIGAGTTVKLRSGSTCSMLRSKTWNPARVAATGMTAVGRVGTIEFGVAPPADLVAGVMVSVLGATNTGFNGVHQITGRGATSLTVRLPRTPAVLTATGSVTVSSVDECVGLVGPGQIDYNEAGQASDGTMNTIAVVWANVGTAIVGEGLKTNNAKKFGFLIAGYRYADVDDLHAETSSDIIHFLGPGTDTRCTHVRGSSGDDSLAFTIGDVSWFCISRGDFFNIDVDGLDTDSTQASIRISGHTGHKFYRARLHNIFGSSAASPITIADYNAELRGLDFDHIEIKNVNVETATQAPIVVVSTQIAGGGDRIDVDVTQLPSNGEALAISGTTTTVRNARVKVSNPVDGCTKGALLVSTGSTLNSACVEGIRAAYGSNVFSVWVVGTLNELRVHDCELSGSGSRMVAQQGTMGRVMMNNVRHSSGYRTFEQSAAANAGITLMMSNVRVNTITNLAHFEKAATLLTSNVEIQSGGATAGISANGVSTSVAWSGDAQFNGVTESTLAGGATLIKTSSAVL